MSPHALVTRVTIVAGLCLVGAVALAGCTPTPSAPPPKSRVTNYRALEASVFAELNAARSNPGAYREHLTPLLSLYSGTLLRRPGWPAPVQTNEGASALREAISFLGHQRRVGALTLSDGLSRAARDLANDQSHTGAIGHSSSNGASPTDRIDRYGEWSGSYSENADYGGVASGRDVIEDMIIDDGVRDRGHRTNTFDPDARVVGVGCAPHPRYGVVCVIDQAGAFTPR